ncbi:MAG: hypothetical protein BZY88_16635 [SAR202 cluster bacterium Io17-Chloro-G9]|nr:MAG: hypothetical protein BZY88_16635 [SAR202 cluster bacterium Io17-Chloro-G9]
MATVLVVDDESDIRELLVDTLIDAGFQVIEAANGESALERAFRDRPDIILLDIWMPGMDGYEALWRLKEKPDTQDLPVILLTAMPASEGEQVGMDLGVSHYMSKPWEPGVVEAVVRVALSEAGIAIDNLNDDDIVDPEGISTDSVAFGANNVDLKVKDAQIFSIQSGMARLRRARKKKPSEDGEDARTIKTGGKLVSLERAMGGGISLGSVVMAVGSASSGKSVLCQHLTFGALEQGYGAAFFPPSIPRIVCLTRCRKLAWMFQNTCAKINWAFMPCRKSLKGKMPSKRLENLGWLSSGCHWEPNSSPSIPSRIWQVLVRPRPPSAFSPTAEGWAAKEGPYSSPSTRTPLAQRCLPGSAVFATGISPWARSKCKAGN